ncbi:DUF305 domain-containing protein [Pseudonocardiaceae bacterium YIM PH 21723]|nr:DUF305 domain-containing protein [Pseudonocardiaceae bacterium YIM PH 21723]
MSRYRILALAASAVMLLGLGVLGGLALGPDREPVGGPVDIGFSQDMIEHHQQAVDMAEAARGRATPQVSAIAAGIAGTQLKEIGTMQGWLTLWRAPLVGGGQPMAWMHEDHGSGDAPMPGMVSVPELQQLREATGADLDRRFLELMIRHHRGGAQMAGYAARHAETEVVRSTAAVIAADQLKEIATMNALLAGVG